MIASLIKSIILGLLIAVIISIILLFSISICFESNGKINFKETIKTFKNTVIAFIEHIPRP